MDQILKRFTKNSQGTETTLDFDHGSNLSGKRNEEFDGDISKLVSKASLKSENKRNSSNGEYEMKQKDIANILEILDKAPMKNGQPMQNVFSSSSIELMSDSDGLDEKRIPETRSGVGNLAAQIELLNSKIELLQNGINIDSKNREKALKEREDHLKLMEDSIQESKQKLENDVLCAKKATEEFEGLKKNEILRLSKERDNFQKEINESKESLVNEKYLFQKRKCEWEADKRILIQTANLERKECAKLKSELEFKQRKVQILQDELEQTIFTERESIKNDLQNLEAEQRELSFKFGKMHTDKLSLKKERFELELLAKKLDAKSQFIEQAYQELGKHVKLLPGDKDSLPRKVYYQSRLPKQTQVDISPNQISVPGGHYKDVKKLELELDRLLMNDKVIFIDRQEFE